MTAGPIRLYSYWRSSAAYRVRIALNVKGLPFETIPVNLVKDGGEQHSAAYKEVNPQEMVPVLLHGSRVLRQSMAIIDYLDETWPSPTPTLMPLGARDRQRALAIAHMVACDIHPINNLRVQQYLEKTFGASQAQKDEWVRHWIVAGFDAVEKVLSDNPSTGAFCEGDVPSLADCCLVPQVYNALRFNVDMKPYPTIRRVYDDCMELEAFDLARPEKQPDAPAA